MGKGPYFQNIRRKKIPKNNVESSIEPPTAESYFCTSGRFFHSGSHNIIIMIWAAVCLCSFGFMKSGEITLPSESAYDPETHLSYEDIAIDDPLAPTFMRVHFKASKMDPFRK